MRNQHDIDLLPEELQAILAEFSKSPLKFWKQKTSEELYDILASFKFYEHSEDRLTARNAKRFVNCLETKLQSLRELKLGLKAQNNHHIQGQKSISKENAQREQKQSIKRHQQEIIHIEDDQVIQNIRIQVSSNDNSEREPQVQPQQPQIQLQKPQIQLQKPQIQLQKPHVQLQQPDVQPQQSQVIEQQSHVVQTSEQIPVNQQNNHRKQCFLKLLYGRWKTCDLNLVKTFGEMKQIYSEMGYLDNFEIVDDIGRRYRDEQEIQPFLGRNKKFHVLLPIRTSGG